MNNHSQLITEYVEGWKQNNEQRILGSLSNDCKIIESHGPTYYGKQQVSDWFRVWLKEGGVVKKWDIIDFYQTDKPDTIVFEWYFECFASGKDYKIPGISVVKLKDEKICFIHEYRMTKLAFDWEGKKLDS